MIVGALRGRLIALGKATAVANPNIAFIKYWGNTDRALNLPANPSLSMNLAALTTVTTVEFQADLPGDVVRIGDQPAGREALVRVIDHLDRVRSMAGISDRARVASRNDFPAGAGLASSASGFAALSLAATRAAGLVLNEAELSRLARLGSGSACRSVPAGFSLWEGTSDETSFARQLAAADYWALRDVIAIVSSGHKSVASQDGHSLAQGSPYHQVRLAAVPQMLARARAAILARDLTVLGPVVEADALAMHGVMITSQPPLMYWLPATVVVLHAVHDWRNDGLGVYYTVDAGPNVHCICQEADAAQVAARLRNVAGVQEVLTTGPGEAVRLVDYHLF
jgi:diphosphomevalonate decarboxylase